jgi:hypothetical protein
MTRDPPSRALCSLFLSLSLSLSLFPLSLFFSVQVHLAVGTLFHYRAKHLNCANLLSTLVNNHRKKLQGTVVFALCCSLPPLPLAPPYR